MIKPASSSSSLTSSSSINTTTDDDTSLPILSEETVYSGFLKIIKRVVKWYDGSEKTWDIATNNCSSQKGVLVIPYFTNNKSTLLIREWYQGPNQLMYSFPSGLAKDEPSSISASASASASTVNGSANGCVNGGNHHADENQLLLESAKEELLEEARMTGGTWIRLLPDNHPGFTQLKWCSLKVVPYLCIDPQPDQCSDVPKGRSAEEDWIQVHPHQSFEKVAKKIIAAELAPIATHSFMLATNYLRTHGYSDLPVLI